MVDKNLFPYELAIVAIFKNEAPYLREWLDYHLLAGVEHFYLYNNDSTDGHEKILAPYVEANLVTLTDWSGKMRQLFTYNDALERFRFFCRYMAFIDLDEFIFPKTNQNIAEVVDEILSANPNAAGLAVNWQVFGSNGHKTADSRGVLERFTRRAPDYWVELPKNETEVHGGNVYVKPITDPRRTYFFDSPHYAEYFANFYPVNEDGGETFRSGNFPVMSKKIVLNHYFVKSFEEFVTKVNRGSACRNVERKDINLFDMYNRNEVFDDSILKYRAARAENFSLESDEQRFSRVQKVLVETLTQCSPFDAPAEFFVGKIETFLTCRKLAELTGTKIGSRSAEEYALVWLHQTLNTDGALTFADLQLFVDELPEILSRPFPTARKVVQLFREKVLTAMFDGAKFLQAWREFKSLRQLQRLLNLIE